MRTLRATLTAGLVLALCCAAAEAGRRVLDGYRLMSLRLQKDPSSIDLTWSAPRDRSAAAGLEQIPLDPEANPAWFRSRPPDRRKALEPWQADRAAARGPEANYVWNADALNEATVLPFLNDSVAKLRDIFVFAPPAGEPHPRYRYYPNVDVGFGITNSRGWVGHEVQPAKPSDVVRIAVLGDSTTKQYPAMVEHWLNLWASDKKLGVRFEIIDAARPASAAVDAAAIVEHELQPFDPDYIIVYGFGNPISTADSLIALPPGIQRGIPSSAHIPESPFERWLKAAASVLTPLTPWSAAAAFAQHRLTGERGDRLAGEPSKPATKIVFPPGINENAPDPEAISKFRGGYLMGIDLYLQGLNRIDRLRRSRHQRLFTSTFRVLAYDGLVLAKGGENQILYETLNGYWWPYTYDEIHRLVAFYNRTLNAWAARTGNGIIPVDEEMPWNADLFGDGIHMLDAGEALHAWIVVQHLMPAIRADLRSHVLPRHDAVPPLDERYWRIDRVAVTDAIAMAAELNRRAPAVSLAPTDEVRGAFELSAVTRADRDVQLVPGAVPRITTLPEPSAYAAYVPIEPSAVASLSGPGRIDVRLKVTDGRLSVGVLNRERTQFLAYAGVPRSAEIQDVHIDIKNVADVGSVMISNDRGQVRLPSSGELYSIVLGKLRQ